MRILVIQTAFLGDVILTLPMVQSLKKATKDAQISFVAIPDTSEIVQSHPDISEVIAYDKHGKQKSLGSFLSLAKELRERKYDIVLSPHRSIKSCLLTKLSRAKIRIGFDNAALRSCFTARLPWKFGVHEIDRNISLLRPLGIEVRRESPRLFPTDKHRKDAEQFLADNEIRLPYAVIAPGTVWETKRYPIEMMADVARKLLERFANVVIVGGKKDVGFVKDLVGIGRGIISAVGRFSVMSSAEIVRRASLLVANDSAPVHIASAFNVPTVAIFGPTVREFGFFPYHDRSAVVEVDGLRCRPCSMHGTRNCPIGTFVCMKRITPDEVVSRAFELLGSVGDQGS